MNTNKNTIEWVKIMLLIAVFLFSLYGVDILFKQYDVRINKTNESIQIINSLQQKIYNIEANIIEIKCDDNDTYLKKSEVLEDGSVKCIKD